MRPVPTGFKPISRAFFSPPQFRGCRVRNPTVPKASFELIRPKEEPAIVGEIVESSPLCRNVQFSSAVVLAM